MHSPVLVRFEPTHPELRNQSPVQVDPEPEGDASHRACGRRVIPVEDKARHPPSARMRRIFVARQLLLDAASSSYAVMRRQPDSCMLRLRGVSNEVTAAHTLVVGSHSLLDGIWEGRAV